MILSQDNMYCLKKNYDNVLCSKIYKAKHISFKGVYN